MAKRSDSTWFIERLAKIHERSLFRCGQPARDDWLKTRAGQFDRRDLARTFVAVTPGERRVLGYYALASHRARFEALPEEQVVGSIAEKVLRAAPCPVLAIPPTL